MKIVERINFCPTCFSFWHPPLLGWIMGSFIGALLIGKVRGSWIRTHLHPLSAYVNSFPALILSSPCPFPSFTFLCRIEKCFKSFTGSEHKKSHTAFPMEMQLVHYKVNLIYIFGILESESSNKNLWRIWGSSVGGVFRPGGCPEGGSIWLSCSSFSFLFGTASFTGKYLSQNILGDVKQSDFFFCSGWLAQLWPADSWSVKHQPANQPNPGHTECHNCQSLCLCCMQSLNHPTLAMSSKS